MKRKILKVSIVMLLSAILFIGTTILTAEEKLNVDGENKYGFPFRFLIEYSYTCTDCENFQNNTFLLYDLSITIFLSYLIVNYISKRANA